MDELIDWLGSLGEQYGVDPVVYAVLYVGSAPLFFASLAWLIRQLRRDEQWGAAAVSAAFFFSLPTLYIVVAGRELPAWVYVVLAVLTIVGAGLAARRVLSGLREPDDRRR